MYGRLEEKVEENRHCFKNLNAIHVDTVGKGTESLDQQGNNTRRTLCPRKEETQNKVWRMDTWLNEVQKHPALYVLFFSVSFRILHRFLQTVPSPSIVDTDPWRTWKWRNLSVSLVHSLLTGTWAVAW